MKFLGDKIFYISHTKNVMLYDMNTKKKQQIGQANELVLAMFVTANKKRQHDLEGQATDDYFIALLDEGESFSLFSSK